MFRLLPRWRRVDHLLAFNKDVVHPWPHAEHASALTSDGKSLELLNVVTLCHEHVGSRLFRANELVTLGRLGHVLVVAYRAGVLLLALLRLIDACRKHLALLSCGTASVLVLALQISPCPPLLVVVVVVSTHALVKQYELLLLVRSSILKPTTAGVTGARKDLPWHSYPGLSSLSLIAREA